MKLASMTSRRDLALSALCEEAGLKIRARGQAVLKVLDEAVDHLSSKEIYSRAKLIDSRIAMSTVGRTIRDLTGRNLIRRLEFSSGATRYVRANCLGHHHLIDPSTGAISGFSCETVEAAVCSAASAMGIALKSYRLELVGEMQGGQERGTGQTRARV